MIDKLLAHKPADRFQTAREVSETLQSLLRPRKAIAVAATRPVPAATAPAAAEASPAKASAAAAAAPPRPEPRYPSWFQPLAALVERRPTAALVASLGVLLAVFASGFVLARLIR